MTNKPPPKISPAIRDARAERVRLQDAERRAQAGLAGVPPAATTSPTTPLQDGRQAGKVPPEVS